MVFLLNGTTSTCDLDEPIFEHLASWGFIVVGNTDRNTGLGYSAEWGLELMDKLAADRKSVFFKRSMRKIWGSADTPREASAR